MLKENTKDGYAGYGRCLAVWVNFVNSLDPSLPSFRYRALWPALHLGTRGHHTLVTDNPQAVTLTPDTRGVIFTKHFDDTTLQLAWDAQRKDIPVLLELSDNIFASGYRGGVQGVKTVATFRSLAELASAILVPTHALGEIVRQQLNHTQAAIHVVPDCIEQEEQVRMLYTNLYGSNWRLGTPASSTFVLSDSLSVHGKLRRPRTSTKSRSYKQAIRKLVSNDLNSNRALLKAGIQNVLRRLPGGLGTAHKQPSFPLLDTGQSVISHTRQYRKTVLWFGNAGHSAADQGIASILRFSAALTRINREQAIELLVVSNNRAKYDEYIRRLAIPSRYAEWDPVSIFQHLRDADVLILPNNNDDYSRTKSVNRVALALSMGVPVVADDFADLQLFRDCVACEDSYTGLRRYLIENHAEQDINHAQPILAAHYTPQRVSNDLANVLDKVSAEDPRHRPCLLFVFDLIQDFDVLRPILEHFIAMGQWRIKALVSRWLMAQPGVLEDYLANKELKTEVLEREEIIAGQSNSLASAHLVFLAAETSLGPHRVAHRIAQLARKQTIPAVTFQHGLENEGLTYFGENRLVRFASDKIFLWNDLPVDSRHISRRTRKKCQPLGLFRSHDSAQPCKELSHRLRCEKLVGVFENLHWERYSELYRQRFLSSLLTAAQTQPDMYFIVKPHPAGRWFNIASGIPDTLPGNVFVIDYQDELWRQVSANQLLTLVDAVVTTPSTIAVDAALSRLPVAIAAHGLEGLSAYAGLDLLQDAQDWQEFVGRGPDDTVATIQAGQRFLRSRVRKVNPFDELEAEVSKLLRINQPQTVNYAH